MKRNILLAFLLVGLVVMEWGCSDCPDAVGIPSKLVEYDLQVSQYPDNSYSNTSFRFTGIPEIVFKPKSQSTLVYATVGPFGCDSEPDWYDILNRIDSLSVTSDKPYNGQTYITDIIKEKTYDQSFVEIDLTKFHFGGWLYLTEGPTETDTFQFTFQFFDTEGNIFETTTDPIIITP